MIIIRIDIVTDIETLGRRTDSTIIQLSAVAFDLYGDKIIDSFDKMIDIEKETMVVDGCTVKWWLNTDKELLSKIILSEESIPINQAIRDFRDWIDKMDNINYDNKNTYLWGNGILFDNKMIQAQMAKHNLQYPIFYKNDRDMRTILELASLKSGLSESYIKNLCKRDELHEHNALDDCLFQIDVIRKCYNIIMDKE